MKFSPILHRVLILPDRLEEKTASGIIIQHDKREEAAVEKGTVVLVGSTAYKEFGTSAEEQGVIPGARVSFAKYAGKAMLDGDVKYICVNDEDVVCVLEE
jgi:co-chaperonin GroES (HSP10)